MNKIIFENENARLLFEEVKEYFPSLRIHEMTEAMALSMYYHVHQGVVPIVNNESHIPQYKINLV